MQQDNECLLQIKRLYGRIKGIQGNDDATKDILNVIFAMAEYLIKDINPEEKKEGPEKQIQLPQNFIELSTFHKRNANKIGHSTLLAFVGKVKNEFPDAIKKIGRRWYVDPKELVGILATAFPSAAIRCKFFEDLAD